MKNLNSQMISMGIFLILPMLCMAQKPEKIYSITKKTFSIEYYQTQAGLWKKELDKNKKNSKAWDNYYAACRMANLSTRSKEKPYDLDQIIDDMSKTIPNSYEYHKCAHWNDPDSKDDYFHLQAAYKIDPDRPDIYEGMISQYERRRNWKKKKFFNQKLYDSNTTSPGVLAWNYNQLMSIEDNSILITYGDTDTYPSWLLQDVKGIKPDAIVLNIHLLLGDLEYRNEVLKHHNLPAFSGFEKADFSQRTSFAKALVKHLSENTRKAVYLGVGCDRDIIGSMEANLFNVGLAFKYSRNDFNNMDALKDNIENKFLLDNHKIYLHVDNSVSLLNQLDANYLPGFIMLYKHYTKGENEKKNALKHIINNIARRAGMKSTVAELIGAQ